MFQATNNNCYSITYIIQATKMPLTILSRVEGQMTLYEFKHLFVMVRCQAQPFLNSFLNFI